MNMSTPPGDLREQLRELLKPEYFTMPEECFIEQVPHVTEEVHSAFLETLRRSMEQPMMQHWYHPYEVDYDETRVRKPNPLLPKLVGFPDTLRARYDPNMTLLTTTAELYLRVRFHYGDSAATEPALSSTETKEAPTKEKQLATDDLLLDQLEIEKVMDEEDMEAHKEDDPPMKHSLN